MKTKDSVPVIGEHPQPIVTVDVVLLTLKGEDLCAALALRDRPPHAGEWTLPGGWVHTDEDEDALAAATRILKTKTGLESPYLEQLQTFAGRHRDSRGWSVSIAYYALVPHEMVETVTWHPLIEEPPSANSVSSKSKVVHTTLVTGPARIKWRAVDAIRSLPFDHLQILRTAVDRVRSKTLYSSLPVHLMPKTFTLGELQRVYEGVLGSPLDKRGFRRRIEELDLVEAVAGARAEGAAHRPAQRYRVKRRFDRTLATADKVLGLKTE